jgi:hypothetical protein
MKRNKTMISKRTWEEFRNAKLLWWTNRFLHLLGWAIVFEWGKDGKIKQVYPARVKFRGFSEKIERNGFAGLSKYMRTEAKTLEKEANE